MSRKKAFPKPTGIAVAAATAGVLFHLSVFFLLRIEIATPSPISESTPVFAYLGDAYPTTTALIDPLSLLVSTERSVPPLDTNDFRNLSISREISPFPPFFVTGESQEWGDWIPPETRDDNPGAWLLEQDESSLRDFGRTPLPEITLPADKMTLIVTNLDNNGVIRVESLPLPTSVYEAAVGSTLLSPTSFLLDRTSRWSRQPPLPVTSSGKAAIDRILRLQLNSGAVASRLESGYFLVTFFFPPETAKVSSDSSAK